MALAGPIQSAGHAMQPRPSTCDKGGALEVDKAAAVPGKERAARASQSPGGQGAGSSISSSSGGNVGQTNGSKYAVSYNAERIIGCGSFGVVFQATVVGSDEVVAIKKVLQDKRFKNRELQIMRILSKVCLSF